MMGASESSANTNSGWLDFPFLDDDTTVGYLGDSKTLVLVRGASGSGKSTIAQAICDKYPGKALVCSAQSHLPDDAKPPFSKETLEEAHHKCQECVRKHCAEGTPLVVVDNTNVALSEIQKYDSIGQEFNYVALLVEPKTVEAIRMKVEKLQNPLYPLFYGWFVNERDSQKLRSVGTTFYERCLAKPQFKDEFVKHLLPVPGQPTPDPNNYFSAKDYPVGPLLLHCTAFYSNYGAIVASAEYAAREAVKTNNGKAFTISIIGLLITPRSLGFRLKLNEKELPLWFEEKDDSSQKESEAGKTQSSVDAKTSVESSSADDACIITPLSPTCGTGSRAHFSLASGPGVEAVQTGLDLVEIIRLEQEAARLHGKCFTRIRIDGGMACGYGDGNWMVIFDEPQTVKALYSKYY